MCRRLVQWNSEPPTRHPQQRLAPELTADANIHALQQALTASTGDNGTSHGAHTWVDTVAGLKQACGALAQYQIVAVDIEAHHVWSFQELVCLIQLAGGQECYIVDALALHDHLSLLKPILEGTDVLKVLHGCRADVQWLQGLGIYICNTLDTCELALVRSVQCAARNCNAFCVKSIACT